MIAFLGAMWVLWEIVGADGVPTRGARVGRVLLREVLPPKDI
jgi:hypothetical protein